MKRLVLLLAVLLLAVAPAQAQVNVTLTPTPKVQWLDLNGDPLAAGHVHAYISGTTTNQATYTDSTGAVANSNPVVLDAAGRAEIWLEDGLAYTLALHDSSNALVWSVDGVSAGDLETALVVGTTAVTFTSTPTFDSSTASYFSITLTGNVTSSTISNASDGRIIYFNICQDATGGRTFVWPATVLTAPTIGRIASSCTSASFIYDGTNWRELAEASRATTIIDVGLSHVDTTVASTLINACIAGLPSSGGICDARALEGAQIISSTITVNKPVIILLGYTTYTTSASPAFDFVRAGRYSSLTGVGKGSSTDGGTRIVAASSGISPLIRILGTDTSTRTSVIRIADLTIEGTDTADGQIGLLANFATGGLVERVQFAELGQAVDLDDVFSFRFRGGNFFHCGTGDTAATATVRIENRTTPGTSSEQFWFEEMLWEGDITGGNNKQGTALHIGVAVTQVWLKNSKLDYANTNPDFRIVVVDKADQIFIGPGNIIGATSIVTAAATVEITGTSGDRATAVRVYNNEISFSNTVTGVNLDWGTQNEVIGGVFRGGGSGTAITITSNHLAGTIGPFQMASADTPISNSATQVVTLFREQTTGDAWHTLDAFAAGTTPATAGEFRLGAAGTIRWRNNADSATLTGIGLNGSDDLVLGDAAGTETRIVGKLGFGNVAPQATGIIGPNNECYQSLDAGSAPVCMAVVDATDVLVRGNDSDLVATLDTPLEGTLSNTPRWIFKQVDHTDMTAAATADDFVLWTLPANTMIHDVVGTVVTAWEAAVGLSAAVCSVGTAAGAANDLTLDDDFFAIATVYELHDATASGGKGALLFDATDKFAPFMLVASGDIEIQCDLTGDDHADTNAGQARIYILVSQPLGNTTTEAN